MNKQKSSFYVNDVNGVKQEEIDQIKRITGINMGQLPFTYLGVNISPKRLSISACHCLTDKIVSRIRVIPAAVLCGQSGFG